MFFYRLIGDLGYLFMCFYLFSSWLFFFLMIYCLCYYSCPIFFPFPPSTQLTPTFHSPSPHSCLCPWVLHICSFTNPSPSVNHLPEVGITVVPTCLLTSYRGQSLPEFRASGSILLISLFCSLDSSYK